ncbi:MAG: SDR family oxidoreductase [Deltaproteobacteria bacterium]|nr:SDR family oxidoreductase [Deltaproteobacteria bacterium]
MKRLQDKVAIVTGASSGFGRAVAKAFAEDGAKVVCSDLRPEALEGGYESDISISTDEAIRKAGGDAIFVKCDVSKVDEVAALVEAAVDKYGKLDIMMANAGVFAGMGKIHEKTEAQYDFTMNVNVRGVWNADQQAIIQMLKQGTGGKILNLVSIGGLIGLANEPAYCASKGAAANLTRQLAVDYGMNGITVNGLCPNFANTAMCRPYYEQDEIKTYLEEVTPLGRWATAEDIAKLAVFLASSDADYITGALIPIDGGYVAR